MESVEYVRALRRYWLVIIAAVLVAVVVAWFTRSLDSGKGQTPLFEASTVLLNTTTGFQSVQSGLSDTTTVAALTTIAPIPLRVASDIGYTGRPEDLVRKVTATVDESTSLLSITATSSDPKQAKLLADAFAEELLARLTEIKAEDAAKEIQSLKAQIRTINKQIQEAGSTDTRDLVSRRSQLQQQLAGLTSADPDPGFQIVTNGTAEPVAPTGFRAPRSLRIRALIAGLIGLVAGVIIAFVLARVDTRIWTKHAAEATYSLPVLAEVPVFGRRHRAPLIVVTEPASHAAEAFRLLGAEVIRGVPPEGGPLTARNGEAAALPRTLLITSAGPSEGKTTVTANLAVALSELGKKVLVVSCDFHRPRIHQLFGVSNDGGVSSCLATRNGGPVLAEFVEKTSVDRVLVVPSGPAPKTAAELLASEKMRAALREAQELADMVLLDTPPILVASDATYLLPAVDGVLVVARAGRTRSELAERTSELLRRQGAPVMGVVLNWATEIALPRGYRVYYRKVAGQNVGDFPNYRVTQGAGSI